MSYRGPKAKKSRRLGVAISPKAQKFLETRPQAPGMHGGKGRRMNKLSDFGRQLMEKQRLRFQYNLAEHNLRKAYKEATRRSGSTPEELIAILEGRLDAFVYRAGFARSIHAARQYVNHGHFLVNGKKVDIPSFQVAVNDLVEVRPKSKELGCFQFALSTANAVPYISTDDKDMSARLNYSPTRDEIPVICDIPVVVEFYSR